MYLRHKDLHDYWVLDVEGDDLKATVIWCIVLINVASKERVVFGPNDVNHFRDWVLVHPRAIFVGHNILPFDAPTLNRLVSAGITNDRIVDTLILSYLYNPRMPGGHSLAAWGERLKFPKGNFHDFSHYSEEMLTYCIQDVELTLKVFLALSKRMLQQGFSEKSCELEHEIRAVLDKQQENGFYFEIEKAEELQAALLAKQQALEGPIRELFPPLLAPVASYNYRLKKDGQPVASYLRHIEEYPDVRLNANGSYDCYDWVTFNIGSPKQRIEKLLSLGWKPVKFTKKTEKGGGGNPQVDEESLVDFANKAKRPEIKAIADWLVLQGRISMLGTWLGCVDRTTHRMHGKVFTCGAGSRRMTHTTPNCVPLYSQALSRNGWKNWDQLVIGEDILAYDLTSQTKKWTPLLGISVFDEANIYSFGQKHPRKRLYCTDNHSWVCAARDAKKGEDLKEVLKPANKLRNNARIRIDAPFDNDVKESGFQLIREKYGYAVQKRLLADPNQRMGYNVAQTGNTFMRTKDMSLRFEGSGPVWCPTTEFGTWIMKQDDFITITGNTANIPKAKARVPYGKEMRELWSIEDKINRRLVGYDARGLENACLAHYLGTDEARVMFCEKDSHAIVTALLGFEPEMRDLTVKNGWYAMVYGAQDPKLGATFNPELRGKAAKDFGKWARGVLWDKVPGLGKLMKDILREYEENNGWIECIDGGFVRCPSPHAVLNYKLQPAGGIVMKQASIILDRHILQKGLDCLKCGDIHDEGQLDTFIKDSEEAGKLAVQSIREAGEELNFRVPLDGSYSIGTNWSQTH